MTQKIKIHCKKIFKCDFNAEIELKRFSSKPNVFRYLLCVCENISIHYIIFFRILFCVLLLIQVTSFCFYLVFEFQIRWYCLLFFLLFHHMKYHFMVWTLMKKSVKGMSIFESWNQYDKILFTCMLLWGFIKIIKGLHFQFPLHICCHFRI